MAVRDAWQTDTDVGSPATGAGVRTHPARRWTDEEWSPESGRSMQDRDVGLSKALGWFSVALGVAELVAPRGLARMIGIHDDDDNRRLLQAMGLRELATGVAILAQPERPGWLWARVGGDMIDLAMLGSALKSEHSDRGRVTAATAAVLGVTALDVLTGQRLASREWNGRDLAVEEPRRGIRVRRSITVQRSPEEVYQFWRDFRNLPTFMSHLESVEVIDERRSRWRAKAPAGTTVEWEAELVEDQPAERIAWRSIEGSEVDNAGSVRFTPAPGDRGTEIHVELEYDPPGGKLGAIVAKLFGEAPEQQVSGDLRRFKQVMETGEVVHSDASIHRTPHPAQPAAEP